MTQARSGGEADRAGRSLYPPCSLGSVQWSRAPGKRTKGKRQDVISSTEPSTGAKSVELAGGKLETVGALGSPAEVSKPPRARRKKKIPHEKSLDEIAVPDAPPNPRRWFPKSKSKSKKADKEAAICDVGVCEGTDAVVVVNMSSSTAVSGDGLLAPPAKSASTPSSAAMLLQQAPQGDWSPGLSACSTTPSKSFGGSGRSTRQGKTSKGGAETKCKMSYLQAALAPHSMPRALESSEGAEERGNKGTLQGTVSPESLPVALKSSGGEETSKRPNNGTEEHCIASSQSSQADSWHPSMRASDWLSEAQEIPTTESKSLRGRDNAIASSESSRRGKKLKNKPLIIVHSPLRSTCRGIKSGELCKIRDVSALTDADLWHMFDHIAGHAQFRWFAGRSILDFKVEGKRSVVLSAPYDVLNPLLKTLIALADQSMQEGEELAIIQVIVNFFKDGGNEVKAHRHRCHQICVSLGATRELEVEGNTLLMGHGDALPLNGESHSVPASRLVAAPRVSVCLFYGTVEEYRNGSISVNWTDDGKFGDSFWWTHPQDLGSRRRSGRDGANRGPNTGRMHADSAAGLGRSSSAFAAYGPQKMANEHTSLGSQGGVGRGRNMGYSQGRGRGRRGKNNSHYPDGSRTRI